MNRTRGRWSYLAGEKGRNRVRAFEDGTNRRIFLEVLSNGRKRRIATGHRDRELAKEQAEELAVKLRRPATLAREEITLAALFDNYLREVTPSKGATKQTHDRATAKLVLDILGGGRIASSLTHRDAARFVAERQRRGDRRPRRKPCESEPSPKQEDNPAAVRGRVVGYDVQCLMAVLNWGVRGGLLDRNPLLGFRVPREPSPRRPIVTDDQYKALLEVADAVHPLARLALVLAHETGHRIGAIRNLRWSDVDLRGTESRIKWRAENDKIHFEHSPPITDVAVQELEAARRRRSAIGDGWVIPSPTDSSQPASRHLVRDWWEQMQKAGKLAEEKGRGWHSLRRKFATELKHVPLKDLCYLGGWKDPQTILKCYQRADEATMQEALRSRRVLNA
ncbi:MAG: tyrosine-type recombinase/integrase [Gemmatimonadaceae bacterium]